MSREVYAENGNIKSRDFNGREDCMTTEDYREDGSVLRRHFDYSHVDMSKYWSFDILGIEGNDFSDFGLASGKVVVTYRKDGSKERVEYSGHENGKTAELYGVDGNTKRKEYSGREDGMTAEIYGVDGNIERTEYSGREDGMIARSHIKGGGDRCEYSGREDGMTVKIYDKNDILKRCEYSGREDGVISREFDIPFFADKWYTPEKATVELADGGKIIERYDRGILKHRDYSGCESDIADEYYYKDGSVKSRYFKTREDGLDAEYYREDGSVERQFKNREDGMRRETYNPDGSVRFQQFKNINGQFLDVHYHADGSKECSIKEEEESGLRREVDYHHYNSQGKDDTEAYLRLQSLKQRVKGQNTTNISDVAVSRKVAGNSATFDIFKANFFNQTINA